MALLTILETNRSGNVSKIKYGDKIISLSNIVDFEGHKYQPSVNRYALIHNIFPKTNPDDGHIQECRIVCSNDCDFVIYENELGSPFTILTPEQVAKKFNQLSRAIAKLKRVVLLDIKKLDSFVNELIETI